jgi:phosphate transport system substrate-binding protein
MVRRISTLFAVWMLVHALSHATAQESLTLSGSDTLIYLGQQLSLVYKTKVADVRVAVTGLGLGGSQPLGGTERQPRVVQSERVFLQSNWMHYPVAVDGLVLYVHPSNSVKELSIQQVRDIFLGNIRNWKAVGGTNAPIELYAAESTTGTLDFFQNYVLKGREPYPFVGKNTFEGLVDEITRHPNAIGFSSYFETSELKPIAIRLSSSLAVPPNADSIRTRRYPLSRFIYWHVKRDSDPAVRDFCAWVLSPEGQLVVKGAGFESLTEADRLAAIRQLGVSDNSSSVRTP